MKKVSASEALIMAIAFLYEFEFMANEIDTAKTELSFEVNEQGFLSASWKSEECGEEFYEDNKYETYTLFESSYTIPQVRNFVAKCIEYANESSIVFS